MAPSSARNALSVGQRRRLVRDGFIVLPRLVSRVRVDAALREINRMLGQGRPQGRDAETFDPTWLSEEMSTPAVMELFYRTAVSPLVDSLLGPNKAEPCLRAQIALRFPRAEALLPPGKFLAHVDGFGRNQQITRFTMLVGVLLSDVPRGFMGNLLVYPGAHRRLAHSLKKRGVDTLRAGVSAAIDLPTPLQITGRAGDVVLCHHMLAHDKADNLSPHIRYMAYFRVWHTDAWNDRSPEYLKRALGDPWLEWPGVR